MISEAISLLIFCSAPELSVARYDFAVKYKDEISDYRIMSMFVMPGQEVELEVVARPTTGQYSCITESGMLITTGISKWRWRAPAEKGLYKIRIVNPAQADTLLLNAFVLVPYSEIQDGYLNGYRIGAYPSVLYKKLEIYRPPQGFIEVTPDNQDTYISPHFTLKQFLCKQAGDYPKYIVLRERLILKLEMILEKVNERGYTCETFHVMSGYRTPYYNELIRDVKYSRHVWGGAADIFIDERPKDGMMDDLNGDGVIDHRDADVLYDLIDEMYGRPWYERFIGGLGRYGVTRKHGPFVHIDVRGFHARWGR